MNEFDMNHFLMMHGLIPVNLINDKAHFERFNKERTADNPFAFTIDYDTHDAIEKSINDNLDMDNKVLCYSKGFMPYTVVDLNTYFVFDLQIFSEDMAKMMLKSINRQFSSSKFMKLKDIYAKDSYTDDDLKALRKNIEKILVFCEVRDVETIFDLWTMTLENIYNNGALSKNQYDAMIRYFVLTARKKLEFPTNDFNKKTVEILNATSPDDAFSENSVEKSIPKNTELTLYRGIRPERELIDENALSWTDDEDTARIFADRLSAGNSGKMYKVVINSDKLLAVYDDDTESEFIIDPATIEEYYDNGKIEQLR